MSKHTPGPWHTNLYRSSIGGSITVFHKPFGLGDIAEVFGSEEDARLIASAPELLEALKDVLNNCLDSERLSVAYAKARAAISKAEGA